MKLDPVTGPIPRDKFQEIVVSPHGEARKIIQKYDPLWGRVPGEKFRWKVTVAATRLEGTAFVEAATQKEADDLADKLQDGDVEWGDGFCDFDILTVEPDKIEHL